MTIEALYSVKNKVALITGGTGVLGSAMALSLAENGAEVICVNRSGKIPESLAVEKHIAVVACDVTHEKALQSLASEIKKRHGSLDILVNAAGGNMPGATIGPTESFFDLDMTAYQKVLELNLTAAVKTTRYLAPLMLQKKKGSIVNISSMTATRPISRVLGYGNAKAGLDHFTKFLACEMAAKFGAGIRVNAIAPGFFLTEQNRSLLTKEDGSFTPRAQAIINHTPMARLGKPDELLGALHWLCSDAASFVNGAIVPVDGGFSAYGGF